MHQSIDDQLSTVNCQLSTVNCQLSTVNCQLSTINYQLSTPEQIAKQPTLPTNNGLRNLRAFDTFSLIFLIALPCI
ncbi:MAG: hypothetical protein HC894_11865 [Microcoleus sp. SM1_3_4]|nr:hypothetical protein [Microcoleus sp. SM1_3_4]